MPVHSAVHCFSKSQTRAAPLSRRAHALVLAVHLQKRNKIGLQPARPVPKRPEYSRYWLAFFLLTARRLLMLQDNCWNYWFVHRALNKERHQLSAHDGHF